MEARDLREMSLPEYIAFDRADERNWEYVDGEVFVVEAGPEHTSVKGKLYVALTLALQGKPCIALTDGQKVSTRKTRAYHFPDASVFCGPVVRDVDDDQALTNPTLLAEVLSPSTEGSDRGGKFKHYRSLDSLRECLVVSIETRSMERHRRLDTGEWLLTEIADGSVELSSIGVSIDLASLWVDLDKLGCGEGNQA